jgi:predicted permease
MSTLLDDLRYGARLLRRAPGYTAAAVLALALGIGANTAIFSVVDAVLVAPLPYADPDRLVMVWEDSSHIGFPRNTPAPANWADWKKQNTVFTDVAALRGGRYSITGDGPPEQAQARRVTASLWSVLGVEPLIGHTFTAEEERTDPHLVVLSYGLWQRRYAGDRGVIGRKVLLDAEPYTVVAVMPAGFAFPTRLVDLWTPIAFTPRDLEARGSHYLNCVARLKPTATALQAESEMRVIMKRLEAEHPDTNRHVGAVVVPLREQISGDARPLLIALLCAAGCVLLIACANIANLLLAQGTARQREMAVRASLGAGRRRLVRQLITESLLLAGLGAAAGVVLARLGLRVLETLVPTGLAAVRLQLDARLLLFAVAVSLATGILFGAAPALTAARVELNDALKQGGRGSAGGRRGFLRDALVVAQVSMALVLLSGAALMIRTLYQLSQVDTGIRIDHLLTVQTFLPPTRYPDGARRLAFAESVLRKVSALPGVVDAGYTSNLPFTTRGNSTGYVVQSQDPGDFQAQDALFRVVTPTLLPTLGARLREGRFPDDRDRENTRPIILVNETLANRHWPGRSALGHFVKLSSRGPEAPWLEVVGVLKEIRERGIDVETKPAVYMPLAQAGQEWPVPYELAVRTSVEPLSLAGAVRQAVWSVDREQPISGVRTMEELARPGSRQPPAVHDASCRIRRHRADPRGDRDLRCAVLHGAAAVARDCRPAGYGRASDPCRADDRRPRNDAHLSGCGNRIGRVSRNGAIAAHHALWRGGEGSFDTRFSHRDSCAGRGGRLCNSSQSRRENRPGKRTS